MSGGGHSRSWRTRFLQEAEVSLSPTRTNQSDLSYQVEDLDPALIGIGQLRQLRDRLLKDPRVASRRPEDHPQPALQAAASRPVDSASSSPVPHRIAHDPPNSAASILSSPHKSLCRDEGSTSGSSEGVHLEHNQSVASGSVAGSARSPRSDRPLDLDSLVSDDIAYLKNRFSLSVQDALYRDAIRRRVRAQQLSQQVDDAIKRQATSANKISPRTERLARHRFEKDLRRVFDDIDTDNRNYFTYRQLAKALSHLGLCSPEGDRQSDQMTVAKLWTVLDPDNRGIVTFGDFFRVMRQLASRQTDMWLPEDEDLSVASSKEFGEGPIIQLLKSLYWNRMSYSGLRHLRTPPEEFTFSPTINPTSSFLASQGKTVVLTRHSGSLPIPNAHRYELLLAKAKEIQKRRQEILNRKKEDEMKECTFRPQLSEGSIKITHSYTSRVSLASLAAPPESSSPRNDPNQPSTLEREIHTYCTFRPALNTTPPATVTTKRALMPRGYSESVSRLRRGHQQKQELKHRYDQLGLPPSLQRPRSLPSSTPSTPRGESPDVDSPYPYPPETLSSQTVHQPGSAPGWPPRPLAPPASAWTSEQPSQSMHPNPLVTSRDRPLRTSQTAQATSNPSHVATPLPPGQILNGHVRQAQLDSHSPSQIRNQNQMQGRAGQGRGGAQELSGVAKQGTSGKKGGADAGGGAPEAEAPMMYLHVAIEAGRSAKLAVYPGDEPAQLAAAFAHAYSLDSPTTARLERIIRQQIQQAQSPNR